jgi:indole-3-glycerol phosphate synthase
MFLEKILSVKKEVVIHSKHIRSLADLKDTIRDLRPPRSGNFAEALTASPCAIIAEIKKQSPSKGVIRQDFNHRQIASVYQKNGAAAVSVLTDEEFFGGSKQYLTDIKKIIDLPLLRKDFIIDSYQVYETRALEADALLLIAAILTLEELTELIGLTEMLGMSPLVEVHSREELTKALTAGAGIIGINNRDLKTFSTDLNVSLNLISHVPSDRILVRESGIHTRDDVELLQKSGIHVFLIGETLMRADDIGKKMGELLGRNP